MLFLWALAQAYVQPVKSHYAEDARNCQLLSILKKGCQKEKTGVRYP